MTIKTTLLVCLFLSPLASAKDTNSLYQRLTSAVDKADFIMMASAYHPDAVLVKKGKTTPIKHALTRWTKEGTSWAQKGGKASLEFRFSERVVDETSSFEKGIYKYKTISKTGQEKVYLVHIENLSVKRNGIWVTLMEKQLNNATKSEWENLPKI
jgi:hypothetical protein